jgi:hypothetical protein
MNPNMAPVYIAFVKHQLSYQPSNLAHEKRLKRLGLIVGKSLQTQYELLGKDLQLMRNELIELSKTVFSHEKYTYSNLVFGGKKYYKDLFYTQFETLHQVAPNYFEQYPTVTQFALEENNHQVAIDWGHKFLATDPPAPEQAYMQMGYSFNALNQPDSVAHYFKKSIALKEEIIAQEMERAKSDQRIGLITALQQDIASMNEVLSLE